LEKQEDKSAFEQAQDDYLEQIQSAMDRGDELSPEQVAFLTSMNTKPAEDLPPSLHVPKPKPPRSPAQIAQSMKNIQKINKQNLQTGPKTPKGKEIASRNALKLGIHSQRMMNFIRPCYKTCPEYPCVLVQEGATEPGSHCLEKHSFATSLDAIHDAMMLGNHKDFKGLMAVELASNLEVVKTLRDHIMESPLTLSIKTTSITDKDNNTIVTEQRELKNNPALLPYTQLLRDLGVNFKEALLTPREIARNDIAEKEVETLSDKVARLAKRFKSKASDDEEAEA
jgi:hypothetical protein